MKELYSTLKYVCEGTDAAGVGRYADSLRC